MIFILFYFYLGQSIGENIAVAPAPIEIIVQFQKKVAATTFINSQDNHRTSKWQIVRRISEDWNIWLISIGDSTEAENFISYCKTDNRVISVQKNGRVMLRETTPNDIDFTNQWYLKNTGQTGGTPGADIKVNQAWDITTGGKTVYGDDIVFALIDDGIYKANPDWGDNIWQNPNEIPNNGIDDDGNGFIDDVNGWNFAQMNNNVDSGGHGTNVAGVAAASGNNLLGISGTNWKVKVMTLKFNSNIDQVISAYDYVYKMRKLYNETKGKRGAFVVVSNSSFGSTGFPKNQPAWCNFYDAMGSVGVLNFGATANENKNIDTTSVGDLPSLCPSDYLVIVTASDDNDFKSPNAAFSLNSVDVAAPGKMIYTLSGTGYSNTTGTSLSCPIAASIATLAYSVPCFKFIDFARTNPSGAALYLKNAILSSVDKLDTLKNLVVSGGRINAFKTLQKVMNDCPTFTSVVSSIDNSKLSIYPNPTNNFTDWRIEGGAGASSWQLYTDQGKLILKKSFDTFTSEGTIDLQTLPNGLYFVRFNSEKGCLIYKIVKLN